MHFIQGFQPTLKYIYKLTDCNGDGLYNYQPMQLLQWICTVLKAIYIFLTGICHCTLR